MKDLINKYNGRLLGVTVLFVIASLLIFNNFAHPAYLAWKEFQVLEEELARITNGSVSENNSAAMHSYILRNTYAGKNEQLQQYLFNSLTSICDSVQLTLNDFSAFNDKQNGAVQVITTKVTVEGDFKHILKMIYAVEKMFRGSWISSSVFYLRKDPQTKSQKLWCDVYLQSILKKS